MRQVTGGIALFGGVGAAAQKPAQEAPQTDSDRFIADQPGQGQGRRSNITDQDPIDAVGNGRGGEMRAGTGRTPERPPQNPFNESNERAAGTGMTDSDPTDRVGYGRGPQAPRTCTDADIGTNSDRVGAGRRCR